MRKQQTLAQPHATVIYEAIGEVVSVSNVPGTCVEYLQGYQNKSLSLVLGFSSNFTKSLERNSTVVAMLTVMHLLCAEFFKFLFYNQKRRYHHVK